MGCIKYIFIRFLGMEWVAAGLHGSFDGRRIFRSENCYGFSLSIMQA